MNAGMKNGINLLMILVLFISCVQEKEDNNVLRRVEACMELFPDSALSLLSQIECPECMRGQQRADYALLLTQALDKNYLDNLQSDSLIMIAVEYYKQEGDKLKAGKAYFYYGKVMLLKERFSDAMQAYLEASSLLEETRDYKVQGMVWEYIGYLNSVQGLYENSIDNFKHSIRYYELASDRRRILYGYRNMARGYFSVHHNDSAGWYAEKGLVLSDTVSGMKASFLHLLGLIANNEKRYPQAIEYFSNAMEVCDNLNDKYRYSLSLGRVYSEVGQVELSSIVNLVYLCARDSYRVEREDKAGLGFVDFIFYPENPADTGIILELKVDHTADEAVQQIIDKKYSLRFSGKAGEKAKYTGEILAVGIGYNKKTKKHQCRVITLRKGTLY